MKDKTLSQLLEILSDPAKAEKIIADMEDVNTRAQARLEELRAQDRATKEKVLQAADMMREVEERQATLDAREQTIEADVERLQGERNALIEQIGRLSREESRLSAQALELDHECVVLAQRKGGLEADVAARQETLDQINADIAKRRAELQRLLNA